MKCWHVGFRTRSARARAGGKHRSAMFSTCGRFSSGSFPAFLPPPAVAEMCPGQYSSTFFRFLDGLFPRPERSVTQAERHPKKTRRAMLCAPHAVVHRKVLAQPRFLRCCGWSSTQPRSVPLGPALPDPKQFLTPSFPLCGRHIAVGSSQAQFIDAERRGR
jgi:hypothetical protein